MEGVRILFYANELPPPHFHAQFAEHRAVIDIASLTVMEGFLPVAKRRAVVAWALSQGRAFVAATSHQKVRAIE